jgi:uncharacterized membrane protein YoaK (UPF0700 family)
MRDVIPFVGSKTTRERLDEVFSKKMLGAVLLGGHVSKVIEKFYSIIVMVCFGRDGGSLRVTIGLFILWFVMAIVVLFVFMYWHEIEEAVEEET